MVRPPNARSRRGQEADLDHAPAYAIRKPQLAAGLAWIAPGLEIACGESPRPAGGEGAATPGVQQKPEDFHE